MRDWGNRSETAQHPPRPAADGNISDEPYWSYELDNDDDNFPFSRKIRTFSMPHNFVPSKISKAFNLTLGGAAEVWYSRLAPHSIRSWPDLKKAFLNQYPSRKEGEVRIQLLQDMRQAAGETQKSYLARFSDEKTYCEQVTDKEALSAMKGGLNMNTLFWRDV
ncbi:unnamed protein product [Fraxinus pennsylvanica]|uniref:Retrotransposon gag domain-containing protein n=1 Tax=Fraxinus pennsylvanica TaxID=56036 RepID=A0AAD1Z6T2_9LAMI|nr:unnamed protein product [Fraxinus pennsylvanica]